MRSLEAQPRTWLVALGAVATAAALFAGGTLVDLQPDTVAMVRVRNTTEFDVTVEVANGKRHGWMALATVAHDSQDEVTDVIDQGAEWRIRFRARGTTIDEMRTPRTALARRDWLIDVPDRVGVRLRAAGIPPSP